MACGCSVSSHRPAFSSVVRTLPRARGESVDVPCQRSTHPAHAGEPPLARAEWRPVSRCGGSQKPSSATARVEADLRQARGAGAGAHALRGGVREFHTPRGDGGQPAQLKPRAARWPRIAASSSRTSGTPDVLLLSQPRSVLVPVVLAGGCEEALLYSWPVLSATLAAWRARSSSSPWRPWVHRPNRSSWSIRDRSIPVNFALITAHHASSSHHAGPWYIALPILAVVIGVTILRWRRQGGRRGGLFGGSGDQ